MTRTDTRAHRRRRTPHGVGDGHFLMDLLPAAAYTFVRGMFHRRHRKPWRRRGGRSARVRPIATRSPHRSATSAAWLQLDSRGNPWTTSGGGPRPPPGPRPAVRLNRRPAERARLERGEDTSRVRHVPRAGLAWIAPSRLACHTPLSVSRVCEIARTRRRGFGRLVWCVRARRAWAGVGRTLLVTRPGLPRLERCSSATTPRRANPCPSE